MDEKNERHEGHEFKINPPVSKKLENFWYYYKWHTGVAAFVILVSTILLFQTCSKVEPDAYILYAGTHDIQRVGQNGDVSEYEGALSSLNRICNDYDGDGIINISLLDLFVVNGDEADALLESNPGAEINSALVKEDADTLHQKLLFGEYYLCFLSERLFKEYEERYEGAIFVKIAPYTKEGAEYEYASECGIYLRSLPFANLPEIEKLPDDTVVCLRQLSDISTKLGASDNEEHFARGEEMLKKLLSYGLSK